MKKGVLEGLSTITKVQKILTEIEEKYKEYPGLNVSVQVVEGVLKHTKLKPGKIDLSDFLSKRIFG